MKRALGLAAALCSVLSLVAGCTGSDAAQIGAAGLAGPAPDLDLESLDGRQVSLSQYRGSVVLINFWATWCPPCRNEIPVLEAAYRANKDRGLVVLGVDTGETRQAVRAFVADAGISYVVLLDERNRMLTRYGGLGLPMSVLVDRDGMIRVRHAGDVSEAELKDYLDEYLPVD